MSDTILTNANVYWHAGAWRAIGAALESVPGTGERAAGPRREQLRVAPDVGVGVWINGKSAPALADAAKVAFKLSAARSVRVEVMGGEESIDVEVEIMGGNGQDWVLL
jgi:hypothetical protein